MKKQLLIFIPLLFLLSACASTRTISVTDGFHDSGEKPMVTVVIPRVKQ